MTTKNVTLSPTEAEVAQTEGFNNGSLFPHYKYCHSPRVAHSDVSIFTDIFFTALNLESTGVGRRRNIYGGVLYVENSFCLEHGARAYDGVMCRLNVRGWVHVTPLRDSPIAIKRDPQKALGPIPPGWPTCRRWGLSTQSFWE